MGLVVFLALFFSLIGCSRATMYCICKDGISSSTLQKTIDYACGNGADCRPILQNGACFQPNTVKAHCDYAANSYFQNKGQAVGSCDFSQTAMTSPSPPSVTSGCTYPTSPGQASAGTVGIGTTTPGSAATTGTPDSTASGIYGPTGLAPSGIGDMSPSGGSSLQQYQGKVFSLVQAILLSGLLVLWG